MSGRRAFASLDTEAQAQLSFHDLYLQYDDVMFLRCARSRDVISLAITVFRQIIQSDSRTKLSRLDSNHRCKRHVRVKNLKKTL